MSKIPSNTKASCTVIMWTSGIFRKLNCPIPPCDHGLCQGHVEVGEEEDITRFNQLILEETNGGTFRVRSQHPTRGNWKNFMEFSIGQPFFFHFLWIHMDDGIAESTVDGIVFTPTDDDNTRVNGLFMVFFFME